MGVRIGGSLGPAYISASPKDIGKAATGPLRAIILAGFWIVYGMYLLYKYVFLGLYWSARWLWRQGVAAYRWYQDRQTAKEVERALLRERADAEHRAYMANEDSGVYGQYPPVV